MVLIKKWSDPVSAFLLLLTSEIVLAVPCIYQYVIYLFAYYHAITKWHCECPYVDTMFLSQINPFPLRNSPFVLHYHLFCCEGCVLHMLDINRTIFQLYCCSHIALFSCRNWELHHMLFPKNCTILLWLLHLFLQLGRVDITVKL